MIVHGLGFFQIPQYCWLMLWNFFCCWNFNWAVLLQRQRKTKVSMSSYFLTSPKSPRATTFRYQISRKWLHQTTAAYHLVFQKPFKLENTSMIFKWGIIKHVFVISIDYLFYVKIIRQYLVKTLLFRFFSWKWNFTTVHAEQHEKEMLSPLSLSNPPSSTTKKPWQ